jgi:hypothetical protein
LSRKLYAPAITLKPSTRLRNPLLYRGKMTVHGTALAQATTPYTLVEMRRLLKFLLLTAAIVLVPLRCVQHFSAVTDADIWLRLRTGEWIMQHHAFPHVGLFTQHTELPWIAYSWGFDLLTWNVFHGFGRNGLANLTILLVVLHAMIATVLFVCVYKTSKRFALSAVLVAVVLMAGDVLAIRSLLFSMLFYAIEVYVLLAAERDGQTKRLWWLAPMFVLWTNIHIQFAYGIFVLGVFALAITVASFGAERAARIEAPKIRPVTAWILLGACTLATFVGPYFTSVYQTIFAYAGNTTQYEQIIEYSAINFRQAHHYLQLLLVLAAFFAVGWRRSLDPFRLMLLTSTALVAFRSQRDGWFVCIAAGMLLAEALRKTESLEVNESPRWHWEIPAAFAMAVVIAIGAAAKRGLDPQTLISAVAKEYPVRAASYIAERRPPGPLYNTYNWGEYLVFNLREYPVAIDGRTDLFGPAMDTRAMATVNAYDLQHDPDFQRANIVLLERFLPLVSHLAADPHYKIAYSDEQAVVFVKVP